MNRLIIGLLVFFSVNARAQTTRVNQNDSVGRKHGAWVIEHSKTDTTSHCFTEKGNYVHGKKEGIWQCYYYNGIVSSLVEYKQSRPFGRFETYDMQGNLEEKGIWKKNTYVDTFFHYYPTGCVNYMIVYDTISNQGSKFKTHSDTITFANDCLARYQLGKRTSAWPKMPMCDSTSMAHCAIQSRSATESVLANMIYCTNPAFYSSACSRITGKHRILLPDNKVLFDGEFKNGALYSGSFYTYDENGVLVKIQSYKKGRYSNDVPLPR